MIHRNAVIMIIKLVDALATALSHLSAENDSAYLKPHPAFMEPHFTSLSFIGALLSALSYDKSES